jgi:hypothetical protein
MSVNSIMEILKKKGISNFDIYNLCEKLKVPLNDILMRDQIENKQLQDGNYVFNMDTSDGRGNHWCSFVLDNKTIYYFDSYGMPCAEECVTAWDRVGYKIKCNSVHIQDLKSQLCGFYCIYFLICMQYGAGSKLARMKKCIKSFIMDDYRKDKQNDKLVKEYITKFLKQ